MEISGWGRYPKVEAKCSVPLSESSVLAQISGAGTADLIPRGLGRSYGDAALAASVMCSEGLDQFIDFDAVTGVLSCAAGVSIEELMRVFLPRGWFPVVVPGTRFVSLGGAVASDVHGKNHHRAGSFCDHVSALRIATVSDGIVECSRTLRPELFHASCGGMGLTGMILSLSLRLQRVSSAWIDESVCCAANLAEALALFEQHQQASYSVAWIDCAASGESLGRSVLRLGEHSPSGRLVNPDGRRLSVPIELPGFVLNRQSIKAFNALYYRSARSGSRDNRVPLQSFFFPLDGIGNWNRIYGRQGFVQYQLQLPHAASAEGLQQILELVSSSGQGSFLAVLKQFGEGNNNYLSFPRGGYTLAMDFKRYAGLESLLQQLDAVVCAGGGRLYLAKDARMSASMFRQGYPEWQQFAALRERYRAAEVFNSLLSRRLEL